MLHFILPLMLHFHLNGWAEVSYRKSDVIYLPPFWSTIINKSLSDNMTQIYRLFWMLYFCCCKFSYFLLSAEKMRECLCVIFFWLNYLSFLSSLLQINYFYFKWRFLVLVWSVSADPVTVWICVYIILWDSSLLPIVIVTWICSNKCDTINIEIWSKIW